MKIVFILILGGNKLILTLGFCPLLNLINPKCTLSNSHSLSLLEWHELVKGSGKPHLFRVSIASQFSAEYFSLEASITGILGYPVRTTP